MIKERSSNRFRLVTIDAWRKDKDNFLRHFIKKLANSLLDEENAKETSKKVDARKTEQDSSWLPDSGAQVVFWLFISVAIGLFVLVAIGWVTGTFWKEFGGPFFAVLIAVFFQYFLPRYSHHVTTTWQDVSLDDPIYFRELYFGCILDKTNDARICIAIDNLDRVPAEDALKIS
jgi:hypothetical protein